MLVLFGFLLAACHAVYGQERRFPDDFLFGAATASYQIEGGWNADDKSENIWDHMTHTNPTSIIDKSNGDIAADTYHNYMRDVEMMRELGLDVYRFSLSWPRILPNGLPNKVSKAGVAFYNNYINEMVKYNITPMVTLYHWDMPQKLQVLGGLSNPMFSEWFEDYARIAYVLFGDRVKFWITFNEPREICALGYGGASFAPILNITDVGTYYCAKNLVLAHARAYHAYVNDFKTEQGGVCGITINVFSYEPATDSEEDEFAAEIKRQGELAPNSLYNTLTYLHNKYNGPDFFVTENGWSTFPGASLEDDDRIAYYRSAWEDLLDALDEGVHVKGYTAWSLMDNFEWIQGYTERFGLYEVDFASPARTRTPRKSAFVYKRLLRARTVQHDYDPPMTTMTIDDGH